MNRLIASGVKLSRAQYDARYAPTARQAAALSAWLKGRGLKVVGVASHNLWVKAEGSTTQVANAFGVSINNYRYNGRVFFSNDRAAVVPAALRVSGIDGMSNYLRPQTFLQQAHQSAKPSTGAVPNVAAPYCPSTLSAAYDVTHNGAGQTVDMVLWGAPLPQSDLTLFTNTCGGSLATGAGADHVSFIAVDGADSYTGALDEVALDIDNGHGIAPGAHVNYYLGCTCSGKRASTTPSWTLSTTRPPR